MAGTITYNTGRTNVTHIFRATNGGVNFSADLIGTAFDYFDDAPTADDAVYFLGTSSSNSQCAGIEIDVATAMVGTNIVLKWEYFAKDAGNVWREIPNVDDPTVGLTVTGINQLIYWPFPPFSFSKTIEGIAGYAVVRCRLVSFTTVTEGGANTDDTPQFGDGKIDINDYTEESPASWDDVYTFMNANWPDVGMAPLDDSHKEWVLPHAGFNINSPLEMKKEFLKQGNGSWGTKCSISYLRAGTKIGDDKFGDPSVLVTTNQISSNYFGTSDQTKLYGLTLRSGTYTKEIGGNTYSVEGAGYHFGRGEEIGVVTDIGGGSILYVVTAKNCFYHETGFTLYPFNISSSYENVSYYTTSATPFLRMYAGGATGEMNGLNWHLDSGYLFGVRFGASAQEYNFLNPSPAFPELGADPGYVYTPNAGIWSSWNGTAWHIYERYTLDLRITDVNNVGIVGATVTITDKDGTAVTGSPFTTDASGDIAQAKCLKSHGYSDGVSVIKDEYNPHTVTISKVGYKTRTIKYTMDRKREEIEKLSPDGTDLQDCVFQGNVTIF